MAREIKKQRWITLPSDPEVQFLIKPYSILYVDDTPIELTSVTKMNMQFLNKTRLNAFIKCVVEWKGITDNGVEIECNEKNRRMVGETNLDLCEFVFTESVKDAKQITETEIKN